MAKTNIYSQGIKPFFSFEHLVVGEHNQFAVAACEAVIKSPGETYNPLFIYGPPGVGKTHLMQAVAQNLLSDDPHCKIKYATAERFMSEIISAIADDHVIDARENFYKLNLFILDDIQFLTESRSTQGEFIHLINNLEQKGAQVILAADRPPNQLAALDQNLVSRLEGGLVTQITIPNEQTRVEILRRKQELQGLKLDDDMLHLAADRLNSNVRELEGFLKRMHAYTTLSHQELTDDLVFCVLNELHPEGSNGQSPTTNSRGRPPAVSTPKAALQPLGSEEVVREESSKNGQQAASAPASGEAEGHDKASEDVQPGDLSSKEVPPKEVPPKEVKSVDKKPSAKKSSPKPMAIPSDALVETETNEKENEPARSPEEPGRKDDSSDEIVSAGETQGAPDDEEISPEDVVIGSMGRAEGESGDLPPGHKEVRGVFFYPAGHEDVLKSVHDKFQEVIRKHKLKFRLKKVHAEPYDCKTKVNYSSFVDVCKKNKVPVAIVIGPSPDALMPEQDFYDLLSVTLDVQGISLQLVDWGEINKDYRYLNLALDIALVRSR